MQEVFVLITELLVQLVVVAKPSLGRAASRTLFLGQRGEARAHTFFMPGEPDHAGVLSVASTLPRAQLRTHVYHERPQRRPDVVRQISQAWWHVLEARREVLTLGFTSPTRLATDIWRGGCVKACWCHVTWLEDHTCGTQRPGASDAPTLQISCPTATLSRRQPTAGDYRNAFL